MKRLVLMIISAMICGVVDSNAQDWSQWRGSNREGIVIASGLNLDWSQRKPTLLWTFRQAGAGYSAPVIVGTTLYCQGGANGNDFAFALDTQTGALKWKKILGEEFVEEHGNGSRGSITVDGDKLYLVRSGGQIHCISAVDGRMLWEKDFIKDFGGNIMSRVNYGFSESPLVDGNLVICTPGGEEGTMIALDKNTGDMVWRSKEWTDVGGYCSPIVVEIDGIRQYIQFTRNGVAGIAAKDGKLLWNAKVAGNRLNVISTPIYHDHMVYVTSGNNTGCGAIILRKDGDTYKADTVYTNRNMMNHHGGVVLVNGYIYGCSDDLNLVCQNFKTGEIVWRERSSEIGKGAVLAVNDRLLILSERTGLITVVAASPDGWKEFGSMEIPERSDEETLNNMVWTHPVIANGKLYLKDHNLLFCFDLSN